MQTQWPTLVWITIAFYLILVGISFLLRPFMGEKRWQKLKKHASNSLVFVALLPFHVLFFLIEEFFKCLWAIIAFSFAQVWSWIKGS